MPIHHILCIHGIGKHSTEWTKVDKDDGGVTFENLLEQIWNTYPATSSRGKFSERVKIHSIHYDDEIEKIFKTWEDYVADLKAGLKLSPLLLDQVQWFTDAIDAATQAKADGDFGYTHAMDLVMFAGSLTLQQRLVTYVANQMLEVIKKRESGDKFSVIGHSMGTAMAHKAIQAIFNEGVDTPAGVQKVEGNFKFDNVTMVANTSYTLSRHRDTHYTGKVRPSMTAGDGCCYTWINVNHRFDPVGRFQPFDYRQDPKWLDANVEVRGWHRDILLRQVSSKDIHSINHYFRDPRLHIPFLELVVNAKFTDSQVTKAVEAFAASTPEGKFKGLIAQWELIDVSDKEGFKDFLLALADFRESIRLFGN